MKNIRSALRVVYRKTVYSFLYLSIINILIVRSEDWIIRMCRIFFWESSW